MKNNNKSSFLFYHDWKAIVEILDNDKSPLADFLLQLINYSENGVIPSFSDDKENLCWKLIERQFTRNIDKYNDKCLKNKFNITNRWLKEHGKTPYSSIEEMLENDGTGQFEDY